MASIKAGVIGLGIMGRRHALALQRYEAADVVAVADVRGHVAAEVGSLVGARAFSDYREMLRGEALDLVVVATPDAMHRGPVVDVLEAGVPNGVTTARLAAYASSTSASETDRPRAKLSAVENLSCGPTRSIQS